MGKKNLLPSLVAVIGTIILVALFRFNAKPHGYEEYLITNIAALFWLPIVFILLFAREDPASFGFGLGDYNKGYKLAGILFVAVLPILFFAARMPQFQSYYPIQQQAAHDLPYFVYFEISYGMYLFCWEFFFRGFLLFGLSRSIGWWSVLVQAIAFGIMHYGKPGPEFMVSFATGVILGIVALRVKSFVPCFLVHWVSAIAFDVLIIMGKRGILF